MQTAAVKKEKLRRSHFQPLRVSVFFWTSGKLAASHADLRPRVFVPLELGSHLHLRRSQVAIESAHLIRKTTDPTLNPISRHRGLKTLFPPARRRGRRGQNTIARGMNIHHAVSQSILMAAEELEMIGEANTKRGLGGKEGEDTPKSSNLGA